MWVVRRALPEDYQVVQGPGAWGFTSPAAHAWVAELLSSGIALREAGARHPEAVRMQGRGPVWVVPLGAGRCVIRPYRRGGAVAAPLLRDWYVRGGTPRPVAEARANAEVRARGIPTPPVLAGAVYARGPLYRADLVTEYIAGSLDLSTLLFSDRADDDARLRALDDAGHLIARMSLAGVEHPDMNAKNVLISVPRSPGALLLDLDRCRVHSLATALPPIPMLRRLERSLRRLGDAAGRPLRTDEWAALRAAAMHSS